jgi:hypothetical protein
MIMEESSLQRNLWTTTTVMEYKGNSSFLGHLNIMELLKEIIGKYMKWPEQC